MRILTPSKTLNIVLFACALALAGCSDDNTQSPDGATSSNETSGNTSGGTSDSNGETSGNTSNGTGDSNGETSNGTTGGGEDPPIVCRESNGQDEAFDVEVANLSGSVSASGQTSRSFLGWETDTFLVLVDPILGSHYSAPLEGGPGSSFNATAPHGTYDVMFVLRGYTSFRIESTILLAESVVLDRDMEMNFDISIAAWSGRLRLGDGELPEAVRGEANRGTLTFHDPERGFSMTIQVPATGDAAFDILLPNDRSYDVSWERTGSVAYPDPTPDPVPYGQIDLGTIHVEGALQMDLQLGRNVDLQGEVFVETTNGAEPLPDIARTDGDPRASLLFVAGDDVWDRTTVGLGHSGPGTYRVQLLAGDYQVFLETSSGYTAGIFDDDYIRLNLCGDSEGARCTIREGAGLDFGLTAPNPPQFITGDIVFTGERWDALSERPNLSGSLFFTNNQTGERSYGDFERDGSFRAELHNGTYTVELQSRGAVAGNATLSEAFNVQGTQRDVRFETAVVPISGEVLVNGATMPDDSFVDDSVRAELHIWSEGSYNSSIFSLGEEGPATYSLFLFPGQYEARLKAFGNGGHGLLVPNSQDVMPTGNKRVGNFTVEPDATAVVFDMDVEVITFTGQIALDDAWEGSRALRLLDTETEEPLGLWANTQWGKVEPDGQFSMLAYGGSYEVTVGYGDVEFLTNYSNPTILGYLCLGSGASRE